MHHNITARRAGPEDIKLLQRLNLELFEFESQFDHTFSLDWTFSAIGINYFHKRLLEGIVFLAFAEDQAIGYICGYAFSHYARVGPQMAEIENMFVVADYRGQGIGQRLIERFVDVSKASGAQRIRVGALALNQQALSFYKKCGFTSHEVVFEKEL